MARRKTTYRCARRNQARVQRRFYDGLDGVYDRTIRGTVGEHMARRPQDPPKARGLSADAVVGTPADDLAAELERLCEEADKCPHTAARLRPKIDDLARQLAWSDQFASSEQDLSTWEAPPAA